MIGGGSTKGCNFPESLKTQKTRNANTVISPDPLQATFCHEYHFSQHKHRHLQNCRKKNAIVDSSISLAVRSSRTYAVYLFRMETERASNSFPVDSRPQWNHLKEFFGSAERGEGERDEFSSTYSKCTRNIPCESWATKAFCELWTTKAFCELWDAVPQPAAKMAGIFGSWVKTALAKMTASFCCWTVAGLVAEWRLDLAPSFSCLKSAVWYGAQKTMMVLVFLCLL